MVGLTNVTDEYGQPSKGKCDPDSQGSNPRPLLPNDVLAEMNPPSNVFDNHLIFHLVIPFLIRSIPHHSLCRFTLTSTSPLETQSQHRPAYLRPTTTNAALSKDTFRDEPATSAQAPSHLDAIDLTSRLCKYPVSYRIYLHHIRSSPQQIGWLSHIPRLIAFAGLTRITVVPGTNLTCPGSCHMHRE